METQRDARKQKLEHYAGKKLTAFRQLDTFIGVKDAGDCIVMPDGDGDCLFERITCELMSGGPAIRVLVTAEATVADVARAFDKWRQVLEHDGLGALPGTEGVGEWPEAALKAYLVRRPEPGISYSTPGKA